MYKLFIIILLTVSFSQREIKRNPNTLLHNKIYSTNHKYNNEEEIITLIESIIETNHIPGLAVSIIKNNEIIWDQYFGYSNLSDSILVNSNTMFSLASVSKTVTSTALMQLFEEDLFELDDNINLYLPFNVNHPSYPITPITFRMLLTHTSGIKDYWNVMPYYDGDSDIELSYYLEQYLTPGGEFYNSNTCFTNSPPGENYTYSNIAVALIGYLVEELSGIPFNQYCNENIFEPLEMNNTAWFLHEIDNLNQIAYPYLLSGNSGNTCYQIGCGIYDESNPCFCDSECIYYGDCCLDYNQICGENGTGSAEGAITLEQINHYGYSDYPSGQLRISVLDLSKILATYINGGYYNNEYILQQETIKLIQTIQYPNINQNQGLIWYYKTMNERTLLGHNGGDIGTITEMFYSISDKIGVIVLSNTNNYSAVIEIENILFEFAEQEIIQEIGDINQDGSINIQDIILIINIILYYEYNDIADMNSDNEINIQDVILIINIIL